MLVPSIFSDNFFDDFFEFPFIDDRAEKNAERKLYGHHASNLMKTDIKEFDDKYEVEIDLPGFKKDEVQVPWLFICPHWFTKRHISNFDYTQQDMRLQEQ